MDRTDSPQRHGVHGEDSLRDSPSPRGGWGGRLGSLSLWTLCLCGFFLLPGCAAKTEVQKAGSDQDIARDVSWELRKDRRFELAVNVFCVEGTVTLTGRVDSREAEADAIRVAQSRSRGGRVVSKLEIRPR